MRTFVRALQVLPATLVAACALAAPGTPAAVAGDGKSKCTIEGTPGKDRLRGDGGRDVICGMGGNDRLIGRGGRDVLLAGKGDDRLKGGAGRDRLDAGGGDDDCLGSPADTVLTNCFSEYDVSDLVTPDVDTSSGDREVRISVRFTGTEAVPPKILHVTATRSIPGHYGMSDEVVNPEAELELVSGDSRDGVWAGRVSLPQHSMRGSHDIHLQVTRASPYEERTPESFDQTIEFPPDKLRRAGLDPGIAQVGPGDDGPPRLRWVRLSPDQIDTSRGPAQIQVTARFTDKGLGVRSAGAENVDMSLIEGNRHDGVWRGTVTASRYSPQGRYSLVSGVGAFDGVHRMGWSSWDLAELGMEHSVQQVGPGERGAPILLDLDIIEPTPERPTYLVRGRLVDDLTGVADMDVWADDGYSRALIAGWGPADLIEGTPLNGVWEEQVDESYGPTPIGITVTDAFGLVREIRKPELAAAGLPSSLP